MTRRAGIGTTVLAAWAAVGMLAGTASAQQGAPAGSQPPPGAPGSTAGCVPECRSGYICYQGQCISACNPPCTAGQQCNAAGECVTQSAAPPPAPPASYGQSGPQGQQPAPQQQPPVQQAAPYGQQPSQQPPAPYGGQQPSQQPQQPSVWGAPQSSPPPAQQNWGQPPPQKQRDEDPGRGFRIALSLPIIATGGDSTDVATSATTGKLDTTYGAGLLLEGNFSYFGLGGGIRTLFWRYKGESDRIRGTDIYFSPRVRIPFHVGEVFLATPVGINVDRFPSYLTTSVGVGADFAIQLGAQFYLSDKIGLFFDVGGLFREIVLVDDPGSPAFVNRQGLLEFGIAFLP